MLFAFELKDRTDQQLLAGVKVLVAEEREATAQLIAHLAEIDARRLFLAEGCSSLFKYCTEVLHLSESAAYNRIEVARLAQKFPIVLEKLAQGSVHLTAIRLLGPCLTRQNQLALLEAAKHKSKDKVDQIVVALRPRPDVPNVMRKLPERSGPEFPKAENETELFGGDAGSSRTPSETSQEVTVSVATIVAGPALPTPRHHPAVTALSPGRYKIEFTADAETHQVLRQLQELMRHKLPNGDVGKIIKAALHLLLEEVGREKLARVKHPRKRKTDVSELWAKEKTGISGEDEESRDKGAISVSSDNQGEMEGGVGAEVAARESRHIPAEVKRSVWQRDEGQCAFVSRNGRRCSERGRLEFHHVHAYALGGAATIDNIALRCRAHNTHESRLVFSKNGKILTRSGTSFGAGREIKKNRASP